MYPQLYVKWRSQNYAFSSDVLRARNSVHNWRQAIMYIHKVWSFDVIRARNSCTGTHNFYVLNGGLGTMVHTPQLEASHMLNGGFWTMPLVMMYWEQETHTHILRSAIMLNGGLWTMPSVMALQWFLVPNVHLNHHYHNYTTCEALWSSKHYTRSHSSFNTNSWYDYVFNLVCQRSFYHVCTNCIGGQRSKNGALTVCNI